jgi:hypothetical protein
MWLGSVSKTVFCFYVTGLKAQKVLLLLDGNIRHISAETDNTAIVVISIIIAYFCSSLKL